MQFPPTAPFLFFEDTFGPDRDGSALLFQSPFEILVCQTPKDIFPFLETLEVWQKKGFFVAGWFSYEAGLAFHPGKIAQKTKTNPLAWFGAFKAPRVFTKAQADVLFSNLASSSQKAELAKQPKPKETRKEFLKKIQLIKNYIAAGDAYQINHTFPLKFNIFGPPAVFYGNLRKNQPVPFSALIQHDGQTIMSLSPELFISREGERLTSRPMKGTVAPGLSLEEKNKNAKALKKDEKNRAENLMIADLIRNDLSRISQPGSVKVPELFEVEHFKTVLQMSSTVTSTLKAGVSFGEIFKAVYPCGSITGAPKIRAMEIIHETESEPRGVYTGAIGFMTPSGDFKFSVPIRTIVADALGRATMGIGSGIVAQSDPVEEYDECLLKGHFLSLKEKPFALIETLLWDHTNGFKYFEAHLTRMKKSAGYFGIPFSKGKIRKKIVGFVSPLLRNETYKIRLLLNKNGVPSLKAKIIKPRPKSKSVKIFISNTRVNSGDVWLYHKTTNRHLYNKEYQRAKALGFYDVIFLNEKGYVTEGTFNNVFIKKNRVDYFTPPIQDGLLPGILRQELIDSGNYKETSLTCDDLLNAKEMWVGNSVAGLVRAKLENLSKR